MPSKTTAKTLRAAGYARVSTAKQTGERHSSLETQKSRFHEYCRTHNPTPVAFFVDVASGRRTDRREYQQMLELAKQGQVDVIVTQFLDRLGRRPSEIVPRFYGLKEIGVDVVCTDEDVKEELIFLVRAGIAGEESKKNSRRVRSYMGKAVSKGVHAARAPFGLRKRGEVIDGKIVSSWELDPVEAPLVREMYRLAVENNLGYKAIADRLNEAGHNGREGRPFASFTIQKILTNPAIMGTLKWGKKPRKDSPDAEIVEVPEFFPAILSTDEWDALQERLSIRRESSRGRTHKSQYLLAGVARCGHCGGPMVGKQGGRYRRYYCSRTLRAKSLCGVSNGHAAVKLEKALLEYLGQFSDPAMVKQLVEQGQQEIDSRTSLEARTKELKSIETRIQQLDDAVLRDIDRLDRAIITEDEFTRISEVRRSEIAELKEQRDGLTQRVQQMANQEALIDKVPAEIGSFLEDFQEMDIQRQKARLQQILKGVYVRNDNRLEIEFRQ